MAQIINEYILQRLADVPPDFWGGYVIAALMQCGLILAVVATFSAGFIWLERKESGRIQDRLGPTRTGGMFGWLQSPADGLKLLTKEDLIPGNADAFLFRIAPYVAFMASFAAWMAMPFSDGWVALRMNIAIFFILAVVGLEIYGVILAGYASGGKWSLFGAMREAAQVVSYEVPLGMCAVVPVMLCGSMDLIDIANYQSGLFTNWLVFHDPFTFVIFFVFLVCVLASVNRAPFDLAEAESELVAGFLTEYSGFRWSIFFMAEYGSMLLVSCLAAILFLGGWNGPFPIFSWLGWADASGTSMSPLFVFGAQAAGCVNLLTKGFIGVAVMIWVRWTLPRLRIDQVITTCLKYCVPLAAACFVGAIFWTALDIPSPHDMLPPSQSRRPDQDPAVVSTPATDDTTTKGGEQG